MILGSNIKPSQSLYFLGALVLEKLVRERTSMIDSYSLYVSINEDLDISFSHFLNVLNWLFLLDLIDGTENGDIELCF